MRASGFQRVAAVGLLAAATGGLPAASLAAPEATATPVQWSVEAAWRGWSRPGRTSELVLRAQAPQAVTAEFEVRAAGLVRQRPVRLPAGQPWTWTLPVVAAPEVLVSLRPQGLPPDPSAAEALTATRQWRPSLAEAPLLGIAADLPGWEPDGFHRVNLSAQDFPRHAVAFSSMDLLVIDAPTLAALDRHQLEALLGHLARCGRLLSLGVGDAARALIAGAAGCGGSMLRQLPAPPPPGALAQALSDLRSATPAPDLPPHALAGLVGGHAAPWPALAMGFGLGLVAWWLACWWWPVAWATAVCAGLATLAVLAMTAGPGGRSTLVIWSEGHSGAGAARYQALQLHEGRGRGLAEVTLAPQLAPSVRPCRHGSALRLRHAGDDAQQVKAIFDSALFARTELCFEGSFPLARSFGWTAAAASGTRSLTAAGASELTNRGRQAWPEGWWVLERQAGPLPALAAGATAVLPPPPAPPRQPDEPVRALARQRLPAGHPGLLWPLDLAGVAGRPPQTLGWLLVAGDGAP